MGYLEQNAHAIACLSLRILAGPVFQLFYDAQCVIHRAVALTPFDVYYDADAAGVVFKLRIIEPLLGITLL